jgi:hypothetical protein
VEKPLAGQHARELRTNLAILIVILLALCVVGRKTQFWPIMTWPMYSTLTSQFPTSEASIVELRVVTHDGQVLRITPRELFPKGHDKLSKWVIQDAFSGEVESRALANRRWLASAVRDRFPHTDVKSVEGWKIVWDVNPLAIPPLNRDVPAQEVLLGTFPMDPLYARNTVHR